jgi:hypothetical protein
MSYYYSLWKSFVLFTKDKEILKFSEISIVVVDYHTLPANQGIFAWSTFDD